jgi:malate synthase
VQYLEAWLRGTGCVPLYHLMEDAATAEISRAQVWQWIRHGASLPDGRKITSDLARETLREELTKLRGAIGQKVYDSGRFDLASEIFEDITTSDEFVPFLTIPAYEHLD